MLIPSGLRWSAVVWVLLTAVVQAAPGDEKVDALVREVFPRVVECRRDFHAHPERGNREIRTAKRVEEQLRAAGIVEIRTGVGHTGVVAMIRGAKPGPTIALRADMDALPILEQSGVPFASKNPGVMHACGHDAHSAILLGTAEVLQRLRGELKGNVKLIFQPAEEGPPAGEEGGAPLLVKEGVLRNPDVAAIFGLHVHPELPVGTIALRPGVLMAAVDRFRLTIHGRQSHAAMPWQGVDPIVITAQVVTALQTIASRSIDVRQPVVVSVGMVHGGTAWNIIPGKVELEGTVRTHDPAVRKRVKEHFLRIVNETAAAFGGAAEIEYRDHGPAVWNEPGLSERVRASLAQSLSAEKVVEAQPMMGAEDFAYYGVEVPAVFFFLGIRGPGAAIQPLHTPKFTLDEQALAVGVKAFVSVVLDYFERPYVKAEGKEPQRS